MSELILIIKNLINKRKEGAYWDFKREWHKNNADLIRDLISLANTTNYKGDRYLIFGIDDTNFEIHNLTDDSNRKNQAQLLDLISKLIFLGGYTPQILLETICIENQELDIIIIEDNPFKPYCLQTEYYTRGERIYPGTVYSRIGDKNTAKNTTADLYQVEQMWRERFGLDKTPIERLMQYLLNPSTFWANDGILKSYYKDFPEFTLTHNNDSKNSYEHWWSKLLGKNTKINKINFFYHTTQIKEITTCFFEVDRIHIPFPDIHYIKINNERPDPENTLSLYSFTKGTFDFSLLYYLNNDYIKNPEDLFLPNILPQKRNYIKNLPFIVFKSDVEKSSFILYIERNINKFYQESKMISNDDLLATEKKFADWAYKEYYRSKYND